MGTGIFTITGTAGGHISRSSSLLFLSFELSVFPLSRLFFFAEFASLCSATGGAYSYLWVFGRISAWIAKLC